MLDLGFITILTIWSAGLGLRILRSFRATSEAKSDDLGLAILLGFGCLALAMLGVGELGVLNRAGVSLVLIAGAIVGAGELVRLARELSRSREAIVPRLHHLDFAFACLLFITLGGTLLTALAPVTDGDALCYHLQVPKVFLWEERVYFEPDLHETVYPLITELLYAVGLLFRGPVACRLIQWVLGLAFALNVTALARKTSGRKAWWAGTIALLVPAVSNGMTAPLNDVSLAAFGTAAIATWMRFHDQPSIRGVLLAGFASGVALGVKYPALVLVGLIGLLIAAQTFQAIRSKDRLSTNLGGLLKEPIAFTLSVLLVGGVWYFRAWLNTGNPVFPYFRHVFGGAGLDEVLDVSRRAMQVTPWNLLTVLSPMTLNPDRFDSFSHQFGPIFLLFLPALFVERPPRRVWAITAIGFAFLTLCVTQRQSMRFVLTALGPMSVGVAWLALRWWERRTLPSRLLLAILLLSLGFEASIAAARARHGLPTILGRENPSDFLARREPTFQVGQWVDKNLPGNAHIIGQDHRGFYFPRPYTMELAHRRRTGIGRTEVSADSIAQRLASEGFTHLLFCPPIPQDAVEFDPTLGQLTADWVQRQTPVYQKDLADADGVIRRYAIYELPLAEARTDARVRR